jgi:hypothetical protein
MFEFVTINRNRNYLPINTNDNYLESTNNNENNRINLLYDKINKNLIFINLIYFLFLLFILFSINFVNYNQYAFSHNIFTSVDTSNVLEQGLYLYPPWTKLEYFPSTYQHVKLFEPVFSDTGLEFDLEVIFYYKLNKNKLASIYNLFSKNYHGRILSNSKQIIKNIGSKYSVDDYILNRFNIEKDIGVSLSNQLNNEIGVDVNPEFVKITNITFPENVVQTNLLSAIAQQQNDVEINQQNYQSVLAETKYIVSQLNSQSEQINKFSQNEANLLIANSNSLGKNIIGKAKLQGIHNFFKTLNITESKTKNMYIDWFGINDNTNSTLVIGFQSNNLFMNK